MGRGCKCNLTKLNHNLSTLIVKYNKIVKDVSRQTIRILEF